MKNDRAKHKILPPSKFGLIQMTRQRVRPRNGNQRPKEKDPNGGNNEEVEAPILCCYNTMTLGARIPYSQETTKRWCLHVHPFIAAFLKEGFPSIRMKWYFKHKDLGENPAKGRLYLSRVSFSRSRKAKRLR